MIKQIITIAGNYIIICLICKQKNPRACFTKHGDKVT